MSYLDFLSEQGPRFIDGTIMTATQFFLSAILAIMCALTAGLMKLSSNRMIKGTALVYIEIFRGTLTVGPTLLDLLRPTSLWIDAGQVLCRFCRRRTEPRGLWCRTGARRHPIGPQRTVGSGLCDFDVPGQTDVSHHPATGSFEHAAALGQPDDRASEGDRASVVDLGHRPDVRSQTDKRVHLPVCAGLRDRTYHLLHLRPARSYPVHAVA